MGDRDRCAGDGETTILIAGADLCVRPGPHAMTPKAMNPTANRDLAPNMETCAVSTTFVGL